MLGDAALTILDRFDGFDETVDEEDGTKGLTEREGRVIKQKFIDLDLMQRK